MSPEDRTVIAAEIASRIHHEGGGLTEDEQRWVRMAIQREAQAIELRRAIIEKSLGGLVWSAIIGLGYLLLDYAKSHGFKP